MNTKNNVRKLVEIIIYGIVGVMIIISMLLLAYVALKKIAENRGERAHFNFYTVISESMSPNINKNDILLVKKTKIEKLKVGDVITFYPSNNIFATATTTHRIIKILDEDDKYKFITKGDANKSQDAFAVEESKIVGKVILIIPKLGAVQYYVAEHGSKIFLIFTPLAIFIVYGIFKGTKIIKKQRKKRDIGEF